MLLKPMTITRTHTHTHTHTHSPREGGQNKATEEKENGKCSTDKVL